MTEAERHAPHIVGTKFYTQAEAEALVTKERAAIVEWLRMKEAEAERVSDAQSDHTNATWEIGRASGYQEAAEAIERLDHHKEDSKHG